MRVIWMAMAMLPTVAMGESPALFSAGDMVAGAVGRPVDVGDLCTSGGDLGIAPDGVLRSGVAADRSEPYIIMGSSGAQITFSLRGPLTVNSAGQTVYVDYREAVLQSLAGAMKHPCDRDALIFETVNEHPSLGAFLTEF